LTDLQQQLDPTEVAALYLKYADPLGRFLRGVLRDPPLANDVLQAAFAKLVEAGHTVREESRKAWLFQVAYREAMAVRRRQAVGQRVLRQVAWTKHAEGGTREDSLIRRETIERVREAIRQLPQSQQQVLRLRIYEEKTFAEIAAELKIPLGTALGRMRTALEKLRHALPRDDAD
jgi:RNA polymerase sigma-70 factor (ECF subfamily)